MMTRFKVGDKVTVDLDAVARHGLFECQGQLEQFDYLMDHPDEVYVIARTDADATAKIQLDHPVVGITSFFEDELILEVS